MKLSWSLLSWQRNKIAYFFALSFPVISLLWQLPPHFSWYYWQRALQTILLLILGVLSIVIVPIGRGFAQVNEIQFMSIAIKMVIAGIGGLLVGLIFQLYWRKLKMHILILLIINSMFGLPFWFASGGMVGQFDLLCGEKISVSKEIKILGFVGGWGDTASFIIAAINSGKDWQQINASYHDGWEMEPVPNCENIENIGEEFIWVWTTRAVGVSRDGGESWQLWNVECNKYECNYGHVRNVNFADKKNGIITVYPGHSEITTLKTEDGGITWIPE